MIEKVKKRLQTDIEPMKVSDFLGEEEKTPNTISHIYSLISFFKLLEIPIENLMKEINETIFKSRKDFFDMLTIFKSEAIKDGHRYSRISHDSIKKYTTISIDKIKTYIDGLDKETFSKEEEEVIKAWELGGRY